LTATVVAQLKLDADGVVLSACNTAAADKPGAEALSGVARASSMPGAGCSLALVGRFRGDHSTHHFDICHREG
jgi:CHAT domain-containing protein